MYINESLCCMPEMNTTALQIDYNFENGVEPRSSFLQSTPLPNTWTPPQGARVRPAERLHGEQTAGCKLQCP